MPRARAGARAPRADRTYQVQIAQVADLTGLSFGSLQDLDPLATGLEAATTPREVRSDGDLVL